MMNVCVPALHSLNEVDLLLRELELRMTNAVLKSPSYEACLRSPHVLYRVLADFFETQQSEAQCAAAVALSPIDVRRIWVFCFDLTRQHRKEQQKQLNSRNRCTDSNKEEEGKGGESSVAQLRSFITDSLSLPLEALQQAAPIVPVAQPHNIAGATEAEVAAAVSPRQQQQQPRCTLFSLIRPVLPSLLELSYKVDCQLRQPALHPPSVSSALSSSSPTITLSVLVLAAVTASLTATLDRVQAVRWTAQLADDVVATDAAFAQGALQEENAARLSGQTMTLFLASVWRVWGVLDAAHAKPLTMLAERLVKEMANAVATRVSGAVSVAQSTGLPSTSLSSPLLLPAARCAPFTAWLQEALRADGGAIHQQLYGDSVPVRDGPIASATTLEFGEETVDGNESDDSGTDVGTDGEDFWAQLAS